MLVDVAHTLHIVTSHTIMAADDGVCLADIHSDRRHAAMQRPGPECGCCLQLELNVQLQLQQKLCSPAVLTRTPRADLSVKVYTAWLHDCNRQLHDVDGQLFECFW